VKRLEGNWGFSALLMDIPLATNGESGDRTDDLGVAGRPPDPTTAGHMTQVSMKYVSFGSYWRIKVVTHVPPHGFPRHLQHLKIPLFLS